jgi:5'(3')-deoxyribonucleotidase
VGDTVQWLDSEGIPYRDLCFLGNKPQVEADAYVDDAPHNIEALLAGGNEVIVFDQPYTRHVEGVRATTWLEVEELVYESAARHGVALDRQLPGFDSGADRLRRKQ